MEWRSWLQIQAVSAQFQDFKIALFSFFGIVILWAFCQTDSTSVTLDECIDLLVTLVNCHCREHIHCFLNDNVSDGKLSVHLGARSNQIQHVCR